ncbi:hypothetical protein K504DRAFT_489162 [Pleomassaria siparia CBS 279.74]|uniref:Uncharacterized protein n=1 Tax=Pleomassaria siparia CBS 279.74 TaxID=1314801 RepID=A0A6G1KKD8_9PLEO|nr:hypothetical protein K504DRAFT_489162 [Pleomassaria siparia CBS 279.74]
MGSYFSKAKKEDADENTPKNQDPGATDDSTARATPNASSFWNRHTPFSAAFSNPTSFININSFCFFTTVYLLNATVAIDILARKIAKRAMAIKKWCKENPLQATLIITLVITMVIFGVCTPLILTGIGFGAAGPIAGTIAAGWQAAIGNVAAGSLFAFLQSAAMASGGSAIFVLGTAGILSMAFTGGVALWKWLRGDRGGDGDDAGDGDGDADDSDRDDAPEMTQMEVM